jgi:hypothetical protein
MVRPRVGRQSHFSSRDDAFLYKHRSHGAEIHNKKMAQNEYDIMLRSWPGSREPTDAEGRDLPLSEAVPDNHPHWRVRKFDDLLPINYDVEACRFDLNDLGNLSPERRVLVMKARKAALKICRSVSANSLYIFNTSLPLSCTFCNVVGPSSLVTLLTHCYLLRLSQIVSGT